MPNKINIKQPETPVAAEIIATAIVDIAKGMKSLNASRLSRRAIVTLIHDHSKVARRDIQIVLNNLDSLEATWLKKPTA